jgi:N-acetylglutamate synthase-like GNAT family acetyltransferase
MEIRRAQSIDASRIVEVINAAFKRAEGYIIDRDRIDLETVQSLFAKGEFLIAEDDGTLAGCVYLESRGNRTYLGLLAVAPDRQKAGVGSILMRESEIRCAEAGSRYMDLRTLNLREDNRGFYKRRGYVETGTEPFPSEVITQVPCHFVNMSKPLP